MNSPQTPKKESNCVFIGEPPIQYISFRSSLKLIKEAKAQEKKRFLKLIDEFESRFCCPNKPMNTFFYARELTEGLKELKQATKGKGQTPQ